GIFQAGSRLPANMQQQWSSGTLRSLEAGCRNEAVDRRSPGKGHANGDRRLAGTILDRRSDFLNLHPHLKTDFKAKEPSSFSQQSEDLLCRPIRLRTRIKIQPL